LTWLHFFLDNQTAWVYLSEHEHQPNRRITREAGRFVQIESQGCSREKERTERRTAKKSEEK
jgi:hypothetical protein